jgi:hypothetical protein
MAEHQSEKGLSDRDRLITRPAEALPTPQDPKEPRGGTADPKPVPKEGQGTDPKADDIDYTA